MWEVARVLLVGLVAFLLAQWRISSHLSSHQRRDCLAIHALRDNQQIVLRSLVSVVLALSDRPSVGLRPIPEDTLRDITDALARIPDVVNESDC
jgi:hypothetical protein